jgi:hypothetical protein
MMMALQSRRFMFAAVLLVAAAGVLNAGGWVVVTLDTVPDHVMVGNPIALTYAVRQHGSRLTSGLAGRIEARAGRQVVEARPLAVSEGRYAATLTLPTAGTWTIRIESGFGGQFDAATFSLPAIVEGAHAPHLSDAERGQRLFTAKGCVTCHAHPAFKAPNVSAGPALGTAKRQPEYLKKFLARPPQSEPFATGRGPMPDLKLGEMEIASLVAFINATRSAHGGQ